MTTNFISSSAFAPDGTLYWAENKDSKLYTVNTSSGRATAVPGGTIGGRGFVLNAMMIPSDADTTAYVNFVVNGEGTVTMDGKEVSGWQKAAPGSNLELVFAPGGDSNVKKVVVDGEKMEFIYNYTLENVRAWREGTHTVEVTFGSRNIEISASPLTEVYMGKYSLSHHPTYEATLYFRVSNGPLRHTAGVSNYQISIEKDGEPIDKSDLVPGTYDIHVTRAADADWNALDTVLEDCLIIRLKKRVTFQYYYYTPDKKKDLKHNGKIYVFSPFALIWNDDSYYVIGYSDSHQKIVKFRIDRIYGMKITEKFAVRKPEGFKVSDYFSQVFSMYEGTESEITLLCENELMTYVIDRFGESVPVTPADEDHFSATVKVSLSQTFYGWVFSFGGKMKIQAPQEAVDGFQNLLQKFQ